MTLSSGHGQGPLRTTRSLFVTYLDDDILIVRDETGVPDIWLRKVKSHVGAHKHTQSLCGRMHVGVSQQFSKVVQD